MRILVITSCTGRKKYKSSNQLKYEDFASSERRRKRTAELNESKAPAAEMYTGQQHLYLMDGLKQLLETYGQTVVDLNLISAGYGLLSENEVIVPYNITFQKLKKKDILERSDNLHIHEQVGNRLLNYDLVFYLLGKEYVQALQLPFNKVSASVTQIFFAAPSWRHVFSKFLSDIHVVSAGRDLVDKLDGATGYNLKGVLFKRLCETVCSQGFHVFKEVKNDPQRLIEIVPAR